MATTTKLSFRARNLDANKPMCIYLASELPDLSECAPIARAVAQMPTGMEKEEEMESHLQDAIMAQQASTSGIRVDNHVIPTPKVFEVETNRYDETYPEHPLPSKNQYIKVQAWLSLDKEEPEYDLDSEDEVWLAERPHIDPRSFERIFDTLEAQSYNNICYPATARTVLTAFDEVLVDDVYDYWLAKREKATTSRNFHLGVGGLIPRVRTECRKDAQGAVNPYVAFRRRAEKMQTRKNRKNDEDSYEKVLKLGHDLRKTVTLFDMVKRREKTKLALIDLDADILARRMGLEDFGSPIYNQFLSKVRADTAKPLLNGNASKPDGDEPLKKKVKRRKMRSSAANLDREVPSKAWLKKNAEVWNRPPSVFTPIGVSPVVEVERSAQAATDANLDGKYTFKRRKGCIYRAPLPVHITETSHIPPPASETIPNNRRLYQTILPDASGTMRSFGMTRRRLGRGGRVIFDRFVDSSEPRIPKIFDPFDDAFLEDNSATFQARLRSTDDLVDESSSWLSRRRGQVLWKGDSDEERERLWMASAPSDEDEPLTKHPPPSSPPPPPPAPPPIVVQSTPTVVRETAADEEEAENIPSEQDLPGNGPAGRVDQPTSIPTKEVLDDWREASGSPSESNSSSEWAHQSTLGARLAAFAMLSSEEEARTGDHPVARQPPIKESVAGTTVLACTTPSFLLVAPAPSVGS